jgi:hypothetical protein
MTEHASMDASIGWNRPLRIWSSWTCGAIMCDRCGHGVCRWCDRHVCRPRSEPNGYLWRGTSINTCWPALGSLSWTFDILVSTLSWAKASPLIPTHLLCIRLWFLSEIEWFKCIDHWFASRGPWGIDLLRCFLLLLEAWQVLVIVLGHLPWSCEGFAPSPVECHKVAIVYCSCHCNS